MELKENTVIVVLGASGDLAKKKTVSVFKPHLTLKPPLFFLLTAAAL